MLPCVRIGRSSGLAGGSKGIVRRPRGRCIRKDRWAARVWGLSGKLACSRCGTAVVGKVALLDGGNDASSSVRSLGWVCVFDTRISRHWGRLPAKRRFSMHRRAPVPNSKWHRRRRGVALGHHSGLKLDGGWSKNRRA